MNDVETAKNGLVNFWGSHFHFGVEILFVLNLSSFFLMNTCMKQWNHVQHTWITIRDPLVLLQCIAIATQFDRKIKWILTLFV